MDAQAVAAEKAARAKRVAAEVALEKRLDPREKLEVYHPRGGGPRMILASEWKAHENAGFVKVEPRPVAKPATAKKAAKSEPSED